MTLPYPLQAIRTPSGYFIWANIPFWNYIFERIFNLFLLYLYIKNESKPTVTPLLAHRPVLGEHTFSTILPALPTSVLLELCRSRTYLAVRLISHEIRVLPNNTCFYSRSLSRDRWAEILLIFKRRSKTPPDIAGRRCNGDGNRRIGLLPLMFDNISALGAWLKIKRKLVAISNKRMGI